MLEDRNVNSKNKTDYRMGNVMIVEAKNLGKMPDKGKVRKYLNEADVQYGVVTNGMQWNVYLKGKESAEYSFNLKDDTKSVISNAINLTGSLPTRKSKQKYLHLRPRLPHQTARFQLRR